MKMCCLRKQEKSKSNQIDGCLHVDDCLHVTVVYLYIKSTTNQNRG